MLKLMKKSQTFVSMGWGCESGGLLARTRSSSGFIVRYHSGGISARSIEYK